MCGCEHEVGWSLGESGEDSTCLACIVVILEQDSELVVRKKPALRQLVQLLDTEPKNMAQLFSVETRISIHICNCLLGLLPANDVQLSSLINEAVLMIVNCVQSPELVNCLLEVISQQCLDLHNYKKCVGHFSLVGRLASSIPGLSAQMLSCYAPFIEFVCSGLQHPEASVCLSIVSALLPIFKDPSSVAILTHLSEFLIRNLSQALSQLPLNNQDALLGILGLLRVLLGASTTVASSDVLTPMTSSFKRLLLGSSSVVQAACVQCLMALLMSTQEQCVVILLKMDIAEFLFEILPTGNELLISSVFCLLKVFVSSDDFFAHSHSLYGAESIVIALSNAVDSMSSDAVIHGLQLFSSILLKHCNGRLLSGHVVHQSLCVLHSALKNPQRPLFQAATDTFHNILTLDHLGCPAPFGQLLSMLNSVVSRIPVRQYKRTPHAAKKEAKALNDLLTITSRACRFASACKDQPTSDASVFRTHSSVSEENSLEDFALGCLSILSTKCLPHLTNTDVTSFDVLKNALDSITNLSKVVPKKNFHEFAEKLADGGFISFCLQVKTKHGEALKHEVSRGLTCVIHEIDSSIDADDLTKAIHSIHGSSDGICEEITSPALLVIMKCAAMHSDQVLTQEQLLCALDAMWQQNASSHLLIDSLHLIMMYNLKLSAASLLNLVSAIQRNPSAITEVLLQNPKYLSWVFSEEKIADACGLQAVMFVLSEVDSAVWITALQEITCHNSLCVKSCLELIRVGSDITLMINIERIISQNILNTQTPIPEGVEYLIKSLPRLINAMFLNSDSCIFHPGLAALLRLQSQAFEHQNDLNVKIIFHVQKVLSRNEIDPSIEMAVLNFIIMTNIHALLQKSNDACSAILNGEVVGYVQRRMKVLHEEAFPSPSPLILLSVLLIGSKQLPVNVPLSSLANVLPGPSSVGPLSLYASLLLSTESSHNFLEQLTENHHRRLLLIIQQNLAMDNPILRNIASLCFSLMSEYLTQNKEETWISNQPWNQFLFEICFMHSERLNTLPSWMLLLLHTMLQQAKCAAECKTIMKRIVEDFSSNEKYSEGCLQAALLEKTAIEIMKKDGRTTERVHLKWNDVSMQELHQRMLLSCLREITLQLTM